MRIVRVVYRPAVTVAVPVGGDALRSPWRSAGHPVWDPLIG